uniref:Fe-S-containing protein n=1 Tax=Selenomonas sp. F0473 TaxID=999423 RepID=UPI0025EC3A10
DGTEVRVIVVQKGGSAFGVGLDACEICGPTGYLERDGQIVCRLCDVVMNKATIGMPGGCNPIPVEYRVAGGADSGGCT